MVVMVTEHDDGGVVKIMRVVVVSLIKLIVIMVGVAVSVKMMVMVLVIVADELNGVGDGDDEGRGCNIGSTGNRMVKISQNDKYQSWINKRNGGLKMQCYWPCNSFFSSFRKRSSPM